MAFSWPYRVFRHSHTQTMYTTAPRSEMRCWEAGHEKIRQSHPSTLRRGPHGRTVLLGRSSSLLAGELPTDRVGGLVHPGYKWE